MEWTIEELEKISYGSNEWEKFVEWQKSRILERLGRYNNIETVKTQLEERGDLTAYQHYKINVVSNFLLRALNNIETGKYGFCESCKKEISPQRLLLVPGALNCMECENKKPKRKPWDRI